VDVAEVRVDRRAPVLESIRTVTGCGSVGDCQIRRVHIPDRDIRSRVGSILLLTWSTVRAIPCQPATCD
jgi:hypothetical protein